MQLLAQGVPPPDAYERAGYAAEGSSKHNGYRVARQPDVRRAVEALQAPMQRRAQRRFETEFNQLLLHLDAIARSDVAELDEWVKADGDSFSLADLPDSIRWAVREVEVYRRTERHKDGATVTHETRKLKLHDKLRGLELLGQELGGFVNGRDRAKQGLPGVPLQYAELTPEQIAAATAARFVPSRVVALLEEGEEVE